MYRWHSQVGWGVPLQLEGAAGDGEGLAFEIEWGGGEATESEDLTEDGGVDFVAVERALNPKVVLEGGVSVGNEGREIETVN